ncbi:XdhC family protein [Actinacidiphila glaucinigra]|uniref:XdhC family protein n=1 Tax=Actinacidiphila glaucinigra TaxID=235986 RepID=UPI003670D524
MTSTELLNRLDELRHGRTPFVLATVVRAQRPTSARPGDSALVLPDGTIEGFVGGVCAESTVQLQGLRLLETGESVLLRITPGGGAATATAGSAAGSAAEDEGLVTVANPCQSGGTLDIFLEAHLPPLLVHVHGRAPIARALLDLGRALGYDARPAGPGTPLPDDLDAVLVASHGRDEEAPLAAAVRAGVPYVGLVASPRRGAAVLAGLGLTPQERARVHTPAGLDIGARTPPEIAVSVYAEVIAVRRCRAARPARPTGPDTAVPGRPVAEAVDPVCGMTVAVTPGAFALTGPAGGPVYFCGPGCRHAYTDDPDRYAHAS